MSLSSKKKKPFEQKLWGICCSLMSKINILCILVVKVDLVDLGKSWRNGWRSVSEKHTDDWRVITSYVLRNLAPSNLFGVHSGLVQWGNFYPELSRPDQNLAPRSHKVYTFIRNKIPYTRQTNKFNSILWLLNLIQDRKF